MRLIKITALAAVATFAAAVAVASPAQAGNGVVDAGEFGFYYSPGSTGLVFDVPATGWAGDYLSGKVFPKNTSIPVDNNTASYRNRSGQAFYVYTNANHTGAVGCLPAWHVGNASTTFRNTISSWFTDSAVLC